MLGAHIGTLLIPLSRYVRHVTAFEANPKTHELLEINVLLNGCRNITCYNMVANDFFGSIEFVLNTVNSGGSKRLPLVRDEEFFYDNPQVIRAPAIVLDEFLMDKEYEIIFMDIEGSETHAMRGATRLVSRAKVMFSEFTPKHLRLVAGVTVKEFLKLFDEFQTLIIPSKKITVYSEGFYSILNQMYERDEGDAGIIFIRERIHVNFA
jgi:FkbM family methyltransferase